MKDAKVGEPVSAKLITVQPFKKYATTSGEYLSQAGTCYLFGVGLSLAGSAVAISDINNEDSDGTLLVVGGIIAVGGLVFTIVGHTKLLQAGKALGEERKITLHPSSSGLGLALKF